MPFIVMGGTLFASALISCIVLHRTDEPSDDDGKAPSSSSGAKVLRLLSHPSIAITSFGIVATASGVGFLCALLEPHLRQVIIISCVTQHSKMSYYCCTINNRDRKIESFGNIGN
jgi:hypothetical protein